MEGDYFGEEPVRRGERRVRREERDTHVTGIRGNWKEIENVVCVPGRTDFVYLLVNDYRKVKGREFDRERARILWKYEAPRYDPTDGGGRAARRRRIVREVEVVVVAVVAVEIAAAAIMIIIATITTKETLKLHFEIGGWLRRRKGQRERRKRKCRRRPLRATTKSIDYRLFLRLD